MQIHIFYFILTFSLVQLVSGSGAGAGAGNLVERVIELCSGDVEGDRLTGLEHQGLHQGAGRHQGGQGGDCHAVPGGTT